MNKLGKRFKENKVEFWLRDKKHWEKIDKLNWIEEVESNIVGGCFWGDKAYDMLIEEISNKIGIATDEIIIDLENGYLREFLS